MATVLGSYHTHTARCQHAQGDVPDYARAATAAGLLRLGAADHTPLPDGRWAGVRMRLDELPAYEAAVTAAATQPGLRVLRGMECDIDRGYLGWYRDTFAARGYDYLIASVHFVTGRDGAETSAFGCAGDAAALRDYAGRIAAAAESGLFAFVAHPDNIVDRARSWTPDAAAFARDLCAISLRHGLPLELNALGLRENRGYPWRPFWEIAAAAGCRAVASSDAHRPEHVAAGLEDIAGLARGMGIALVDPFSG